MAAELPPLATVADFEALLNLDAGETDHVEALLETASSAVREASGVPITRTTSTVELPGTLEERLVLPGPPVVSVDTVAIDGREAGGWKLVTSSLWRPGGWSPTSTPSTVTVTYTHGLAVVPPWVTGLVVSLAAAARVMAESEILGPPIGLQSERTEDYSRTFETGHASAVSAFDLPAATRIRLRSKFGGGASMVRFL